ADFLVGRLVARLAHRLLDGLADRFVARLVARAALFAIAGLADRLAHGFLDILVAGVPPFFDAGFPDQLVAGLALLRAGLVAALRVAAGLRTTRILITAAVAGKRTGSGPKQADQCSQQRRCRAHPHDLASSSARGPVVKLHQGSPACAGFPTIIGRASLRALPRFTIALGSRRVLGLPNARSPSKLSYRLRFWRTMTATVSSRPCHAGLR